MEIFFYLFIKDKMCYVSINIINLKKNYDFYIFF